MAEIPKNIDPIDLYLESRKDLKREERRDLKKKLAKLTEALPTHQGDLILIRSHLVRECEVFGDELNDENPKTQAVADRIDHYDLGRITGSKLIFAHNLRGDPEVSIPAKSFVCLESSSRAGNIIEIRRRPIHIQQILDKFAIGEGEIKKWANSSAENRERFRQISEVFSQIVFDK